MDWIEGGVCAPLGFLAAGVRAGIKSEGPDVALIASEKPCSAAGVFTRNAFISPPARRSREIVRAGSQVRGVFVNSGCANACTGEQGAEDVEGLVRLTEAALSERLPGVAGEILAAQTGIIGERLLPERVADAIREGAVSLGRDQAKAAARAIMTTDTVPKFCAVEIAAAAGPVRVGGMAKGAGMIAPNMGTMLAFLTTDLAAEGDELQAVLSDVTDETFNAITIDGDGSTSDTVLLLANAASGVKLDETTRPLFAEALGAVCERLARALVADGEGATKLIEITVAGARTGDDARLAARAVAESLLMKTAMFGGDPNWGRIIAALGRSGAEVDPTTAELTIGGVRLFADGTAVAYDHAAAEAAVSGEEIAIRIELGLGDASARMWTCDLSYDYVRINAEYHT